MVAPVAFRLLLGLICLNECSRTQFQGVSGKLIECLKMKKDVKQGSIITTRQFESKTWCGQANGRFLAVTKKRLFYLQCASGKPTQPKGATYELANLTGPNPLIFEAGELCDISENQLKTGGKANILAEKLEGVLLPYNSNSCNALHYITYLLEGQVNTNEIMNLCPLFNPFNINTNIDTFTLADINSYFKLTKSGLQKVQPISTGRNNSNTTSGTTSRTTSRTSSKSSWVSWVWPRTSRRYNSRKAFNVASKKGGGGGHASGGGGHAGGEGSSHGGGESGGESGGEGSPTRTVPAGRAGAAQTSGAARTIQAPLFGVRLPSLGSSYYNPSAYPALGYGSYTYQ